MLVVAWTTRVRKFVRDIRSYEIIEPFAYVLLVIKIGVR